MITWTLTEKQADFIFKVLQQRPFIEVHELLSELLRQANLKPPGTGPEVSGRDAMVDD